MEIRDQYNSEGNVSSVLSTNKHNKNKIFPRI